MDATPSSASEAAREMVAAFVWSTCDEARRKHGGFTLRQAAVAELYERLVQVLDDKSLAAELIDRCLRYIAFFLADSGLHHEAMKAAVGIHHYRSRLLQNAGHAPRAWATRIAGASIALSWDPLRVAAYSLSAYLALAAVLLLTSMITFACTGEACLAMSGPAGADVTPGVYQHLYFAGVTLTTLGYGDVAPNLRHWWGVFPGTIAVLGALLGYVILAGIVAVIVNRSGIHPYARIGEWMAQFEREFIGRPVPLFRWPPEEDDACAREESPRQESN
jgi:hypothetical protein